MGQGTHSTQQGIRQEELGSLSVLRMNILAAEIGVDTARDWMVGKVLLQTRLETTVALIRARAVGMDRCSEIHSLYAWISGGRPTHQGLLQALGVSRWVK